MLRHLLRFVRGCSRKRRDVEAASHANCVAKLTSEQSEWVQCFLGKQMSQPRRVYGYESGADPRTKDGRCRHRAVVGVVLRRISRYQDIAGSNEALITKSNAYAVVPQIKLSVSDKPHGQRGYGEQ